MSATPEIGELDQSALAEWLASRRWFGSKTRELTQVGVIDMPHQDRVPVALLVTILDAPPRMPERPKKRRIAGIDIPEVALAALEPSAPVKVELALRHIGWTAA